MYPARRLVPAGRGGGIKGRSGGGIGRRARGIRHVSVDRVSRGGQGRWRLAAARRRAGRGKAIKGALGGRRQSAAGRAPRLFVGRRPLLPRGCSRRGWCRARCSSGCWRPSRTSSPRPAGTWARAASACRAWTPRMSPWCSSRCDPRASIPTAATATSPWASISTGGERAAAGAFSGHGVGPGT